MCVLPDLFSYCREKESVVSLRGQPWCTRSLISHGGVLTDAPELKRLDKLHAAYWLNGGSHSGLSAPIKHLNVRWRFSHLPWLEGDCSVLPTGDREWSLQDVEGLDGIYLRDWAAPLQVELRGELGSALCVLKVQVLCCCAYSKEKACILLMAKIVLIISGIIVRVLSVPLGVQFFQSNFSTR